MVEYVQIKVKTIIKRLNDVKRQTNYLVCNIEGTGTCFTTSWGHQIIYDKETLIGLLEETGFRDITPYEVGKSEHPALNGIEGHFKELPYEFDLLETMIFEATK